MVIVDDLRSQGFTSVRAIAAELNERGILTPRGGAWHPNVSRSAAVAVASNATLKWVPFSPGNLEN
jgi:hypothetical protein